MKALCIADIHGDITAVTKHADYARRNGIEDVIILGDFPSHCAFRSIDESAKAIRDSFNALIGLKVAAIPGNCDLIDSPRIFEEYGWNLHEKTMKLGTWTVAGFGGSNINPFESPFEMDEEEIYGRLKRLMKPLNQDKTILAVHSPPKNTKCDKNFAGNHVGSTGVRRIIDECQPRLVLCSHIHEAAGTKDAIGGTLVANIGPAGKGRAGIINLGLKPEIDLLNVF